MKKEYSAPTISVTTLDTPSLMAASVGNGGYGQDGAHAQSKKSFIFEDDYDSFEDDI